MHNLIDDAGYFDRKLALRHALFAQLANTSGKHVVPYTEKTSSGLVHRNVDGTRAADFPANWYVQPNLPSKMNTLFPETPANAAATASGRSYHPSRTPRDAK